MADTGKPPETGGGMQTKVMGLPRWGWIGMVTAAAVVGWVWYRSRGSAQPASQPLSVQNTTDAMDDSQWQTLLALLRDFQGQPSTPLPGDGGPDDEEPTTPRVPPTPVAVVPAPSQPAPRQTPAAQYVTVAKYTKINPPWNSTLSGIAKHVGTTVARLMQLNPSITNPNLIHPNQQIRVS